ncbi:MAG TPA: hypothetical protein VM759_03765 [Longimicrobium sp.]|nr:hypothetical protein [Longimicrobium sp.]
MCIRLVLLALLAAAPLCAQRPGDVPRRPRLAVDADTNSAAAYFRLGNQQLGNAPAVAADAFYWAAQLDPASGDALYGRHVALLMTNQRRLVRYSEGDVGTLRSPEVQRIDSLYYRALLRDPFLQRRYDRDLIRQYVLAVMTNPHGGAEERSLATFYTDAIMRELPPMMRGRVMGSEGRLAQALEAYDDALRVSGRRNRVPARVIRHERGRLYALAGNDSMALVELGLALDAAVQEDEGEHLVWFYESKAMLEHSRGMVHERRGDRTAAREAYARALTEDLSYHPAHLRLGIMAMAEGDTVTALAELGLAAQTGSTDVPARQAYGTLLAALHRLPEAEAELLAVTQLAPYYADAWFLLGMVRDWRGEGDAHGAYRAFLDRAPRNHSRRAQAEQILGVPSP